MSNRDKFEFTDEQWDYILNDTWHHDNYYDIMCSILQDRNEKFWENRTFGQWELREEIDKIEAYWKDKVLRLLEYKWRTEE